MTRSALWLLAAFVIVGLSPAAAADVGMTAPPEPPLAAGPPPGTEISPLSRAKPLLPPPQVRYGCQRIWRCDTTVCEWRRGCWGVYGYVETPYYTSALARRQWERHGLPVPYKRRHRHQ